MQQICWYILSGNGTPCLVCSPLGVMSHLGHNSRLGLLKPDDIPAVLSTILHNSPGPVEDLKYSPPLCPPHWRGRMGLSKDEQLRLFTTYNR
jgi:hypothetical protein